LDKLDEKILEVNFMTQMIILNVILVIIFGIAILFKDKQD